MPFVGRTEQLAAVATVLASLETRGSALVVLEGEAGIGKTTLAAEAVARWHGPGRIVRRAKADELGSSSPFGTVMAALGVEGEPTAEALVNALAKLVDDAQVVVVVDDAQWLDPASLLLLGRFLDDLAEHPVAVVLPVRPLPHPRELAALVTHPRRALHLVLPPMTVAELDALVGGRALPLDQVGGNPLYALELAAAASAGTSGVGALAPPLSVTILRRLSYLDARTLSVLRRAALLGAAFDLHDLVLTAGVASGDVVAAVEEASRAGVLRSVADELRFSHDLVRQALYDDVPAPVRRFEHGGIGRALAAAGRPAALVATHLERGALAGDDEAITWLRTAADEVAPRSADAAIGMLRRALDLQPRTDAVRAGLTATMCVLLGRAGRFEEVLALAPAALAAGPPADAAIGLTTSLAQSLAGIGRAGEACRLLEGRAVGASVEHRARLIGSLASTLLANGEADAARRVSEEAVAVALEAGDTHWLLSTYAVQSWLATGAGDPDEGMALAERSLPPGTDDIDPSQAVFGGVPLGVALLEADRIEESVRTLRHAIAIGDAAEAGGNVTLAHLGSGLCAYAAGDLQEAVIAAETALAVSARGGNRTSDLYALALVARVALHRDGPEVAEPLVAAATAQLELTGPALGAELAIWVAAVAADATGRTPDVDLVALAWQLHPLRHLLTWRLVAPDLVRWAVAAGRSDIAAAVVADVQTAAAMVSPASAAAPGRTAMAQWCRGLLEGDHRMVATAIASPRPLEAAAARADAARLALATGARDEAVLLLHEAVAALAALGAAAEAVALVDLARRHRIRVEAPRRRAEDVGSDELTAAERSVAKLAADGLTNRAIGAQLAMSRHTVDTHLRHVYRKLSVSGRVELARRSLS